MAKKQELSKNQKRRAREKAKKQEASNPADQDGEPNNGLAEDTTASSADTAPIKTEETGAPIDVEEAPLLEGLSVDDPLYAQFAGIFRRFQAPDEEETAAREKEKGVIMGQDDDAIPDEGDSDRDPEDEDEDELTSQKKLKKLHQLSVAELKAIARRPELVEWTDANAIEPRLLMDIKSSKNVIPVPPHWSLKRDYLSTKRGLDQSAYKLPKFVQETGIAEMRDAAMEKDKEATLKQKQRERVQPKMGRLDIDYQKLWEAFFRRQTKPTMTRYGESYYEGKEYEVNLRHLKPGNLSEELKEALNMPVGAPPPWLISQQKFGPPPSYPALKIPGLNAPPPPGGKWGYEPGAWGKVPTDKDGKPVWGGDVFGIAQFNQDPSAAAPVDRSHWGELEEDEEEEEEEEDESEDDEDDEEDEDEPDPASVAAGTRTSAGFTSVQPPEPAKKAEPIEVYSGPPRAAGQVIPEQQRSSNGFFGSDRGYDLRGAQGSVPVLGQGERGRKRKVGDIDVSIDLDSEMSKEEVKAHYDDQNKKESVVPGTAWNGLDQEDLSAMIAEEHNKRRKKDEERRSRR